MLPLDTHDTARFETNAAHGTIPLAVGLSLTVPGVPVVFAGDEFALTGADGESSRTPIPWGTEATPVVAERIALYRDLIALRHAHPALQTGGMRFVHVDDEALVFVRESADETVLVVAARGDLSVELDAALLPGAALAEVLFGDATLAIAGDGSLLIDAQGPAFAVWLLSGVRVS